MLCLLAAAAAASTLSAAAALPDQQIIPQIEALPNQPTHWSVIDFKAKANTLHQWLYDVASPAVGSQIFFNSTIIRCDCNAIFSPAFNFQSSSGLH